MKNSINAKMLANFVSRGIFLFNPKFRKFWLESKSNRLKNHLSVKLSSHKNKMWNGTDNNIAPLLSVSSFFVPIVVFMSAVLKDF